MFESSERGPDLSFALYCTASIRPGFLMMLGKKQNGGNVLRQGGISNEIVSFISF